MSSGGAIRSVYAIAGRQAELKMRQCNLFSVVSCLLLSQATVLSCSSTGAPAALCPHPDSVHPDTTSQIPWEQAVQVLLHCDVVKVFQTHDLQVRIELADGTQYFTTQPEIDAAFHLLSEHNLLDELEYWTE